MVDLAATRLAGRTLQHDLLIVGPSLGTSVSSLWSECAEHLGQRFEVYGWDLPGHGRSAPAAGSFSVHDLADAVCALADELGRGRRCWYAGVSLGGMVGVELARRCGPFEAVAAIASADRIGDPDSWRQRAAVVREGGTTVLVDGAVGRWFAPGFSERRPTVAKRLLSALTAVDRASYAECCDALAEADLSGRLSDIRVPLLLAPGSEDEVVLVAQARQVASAALGARLRVLDRCGHLPPAEKPVRVAAILTDFFDTASDQQRRIRGIAVRREVLGVAHVDAAGTRVDRFTADFQDLITRYAWGDIWARPGLDRTTRSVVTLTALVALGHWEEFALHVGAAVRNGLTAEEISEVLLQTAIYCGVPAANRAFAVAQSVLSDGAAGKG